MTDPAAALSQCLRRDRGRILAALIARVGDFQLAEDALQDACVSALLHWGRAGPPHRPEAWLIRAAFRKAIDRLRGAARDGRQATALAQLARDEAADDPASIPDERLRLIFTCCHPALDEKSRCALTLRTVCALTTAEIAAAFLDAEPTMGQRITRAKSRIAALSLRFDLPDAAEWPERLRSVLTVIYLIFTTGHTQSNPSLCQEAIFLARLLLTLLPHDPETQACLALMLFSHARAPARASNGQTIPPEHQDRSLWNAAEITEAITLLNAAISQSRPGPMQLKAAIAASHILPPTPDWPQIEALYARLLELEPTPVIALNRAVALAEIGQPEQALRRLKALAKPLANYQPYHAALAHVLALTANHPAAYAAYTRAIALAANLADAAFLAERRKNLLDAQAVNKTTPES
ncbi:MAG: DUF6596 domain-containing protein [Cypionkella sp.]|uniref:RNA polymerase sigma factor n=1 Tax=Cypionkella sp. TaxID=2811411 RepID=UPI002ABCF6B8|nr:DUF6596 domain-containing protein [Cypionkella sp.]MDZ4312684.1 DUF6596 domain-containing protein [Cypionkella sp.]